MAIMLLSSIATMWGAEVIFTPTQEVCFRTKDGNTGWEYRKDAADDGNVTFEGNYNAGIFTLMKFKVYDLDKATKLTLTLTNGSGADAIRIWSFPTNEWDATSSIDDMVNYTTQVVGFAPRGTGTPNTTYLVVKGTKVSDTEKSTFTITGDALTALRANAAADGTFTLMLTDGSLTSSSSRKYQSSNSANDEANRPTLVADLDINTVTNKATGTQWKTLNAAFSDAEITGATDAIELEVSENQTLTGRLTWNKAYALTITPTKDITIKGHTNQMWFLTNTNNGTLNIGSDTYIITLDGESKTFGAYGVTCYENNSIISLKNVNFKNFNLNNAGWLVNSKANEGQIVLENITFDNCKNPASAFINKLRVTNDRLVLKGYLNQTGCTGTTIYAASEDKNGGTNGRIKVNDNNFTANNPITIKFVGATHAENVVVVIGTTANNAAKFVLTESDYALSRKSNGDLIMVAATAQIGTTRFANLAMAAVAVNDGETITLLADQELSARINVQDKAITIDGANNTIKRATSYTNGLLFLTQAKTANGKNASLTINNATIDGQNVSTTAAVIEASNSGTTTLNNVTMQNIVTSANAAIVNKTSGKLILSGTVVVPSIFLGNNHTLTATGATVSSPITLVTENSRPLGILVKGGSIDDFTNSAFRLSQQGSDLWGMPQAVAGSYSHPALLHTSADITRVKGLLTEEPYKSAYSALEAASAGTKAGAVEWLKRMDKNNWESTYSDYANFSRLVTDAKLAYYLALRYQLKGATAAATAAVNILNDWAANCKGFLRLDGYENNIPDPNEYLMLIQAYQLANAAELLTGYNGWAAADQTSFKNWMKQTFADVAIVFLSTRKNLHYWLNWDLAALNALVSVGVLCDDKALVDYALDYIENGVGTGNKDHAIVVTHNDADSDETLAQCQESGRDQGHATLNVTLMGVLCQMAANANVGKDLFTEYQALEMAEYIGKYNLKNNADAFCYDNVPFAAYSNGEVDHTTISSDARGTVRPSWELFYAYAKDNGKAARYSQMWAEQARNNNAGGETTSAQNDELGFGTLMFMSGDAADYSYTLNVSETGAATLILPFDATIPAGVECYTLNYTAGQNNVTTTTVTETLPANTPVLVKADEGDYTFNGTSIWKKSSTTTVGALTGVYQKTIVPTGSYLLSVKSGVLGFYKANDANSNDANTAESNRAYLTAESSAPMLNINLGNITGINDATLVNSEKVNSEVYDLQGRKLANPTKGMYIVNGKKVVLK